MFAARWPGPPRVAGAADETPCSGQCREVQLDDGVTVLYEHLAVVAGDTGIGAERAKPGLRRT